MYYQAPTIMIEYNRNASRKGIQVNCNKKASPLPRFFLQKSSGWQGSPSSSWVNLFWAATSNSFEPMQWLDNKWKSSKWHEVLLWSDLLEIFKALLTAIENGLMTVIMIVQQSRWGSRLYIPSPPRKHCWNRYCHQVFCHHRHLHHRRRHHESPRPCWSISIVTSISNCQNVHLLHSGWKPATSRHWTSPLKNAIQGRSQGGLFIHFDNLILMWFVWLLLGGTQVEFWFV